MTWLIIYLRGVRIAAGRLVALDDIVWTSSEEEVISSSEEEIHEIY